MQWPGLAKQSHKVVYSVNLAVHILKDKQLYMYDPVLEAMDHIAGTIDSLPSYPLFHYVLSPN